MIAWLAEDRTIHGLEDHAVALMLLTSGLRASELCQLKWGSRTRRKGPGRRRPGYHDRRHLSRDHPGGAGSIGTRGQVVEPVGEPADPGRGVKVSDKVGRMTPCPGKPGRFLAGHSDIMSDIVEGEIDMSPLRRRSPLPVLFFRHLESDQSGVSRQEQDGTGMLTISLSGYPLWNRREQAATPRGTCRAGSTPATSIFQAPKGIFPPTDSGPSNCGTWEYPSWRREARMRFSRSVRESFPPESLTCLQK